MEKFMACSTSRLGMSAKATFIELAETKYPQTFHGEKAIPLEGNSLVPVFLGKLRKDHDFHAWEWSGNRAYRQGDFEVVWDTLAKEWELFDLSTDRTESYNLAARKPEQLKELTTAWYNWAKLTGAKTGK